MVMTMKRFLEEIYYYWISIQPLKVALASVHLQQLFGSQQVILFSKLLAKLVVVFWKFGSLNGFVLFLDKLYAVDNQQFLVA